MRSSILLGLSIVGLASATPAGDGCSSLCIDGFNECGQKWGGCWNVCEPENRPTQPPCSSTLTTTATSTYTGTPVVTDEPEVSTPAGCEDGGELFLCIDYINECGMMYGGCHDVCIQPTPVYTAPPCPTTTDTPEGPTDLPDICDEPGPHSICADGIDECGRGWGLCYDYCATPSPTYPSATGPCEATATSTMAFSYPEDQ